MCCHRRPGYSALVALESGFDLIILKNSLALIERVAELWDEFWRMGPDGVYSAASVPVWAHNLPGLNDMEWFNYVCWKQLDHEGWGRSEGKKLVPVRIQVPKGHVGLGPLASGPGSPPCIRAGSPPLPTSAASADYASAAAAAAIRPTTLRMRALAASRLRLAEKLQQVKHEQSLLHLPGKG